MNSVSCSMELGLKGDEIIEVLDIRASKDEVPDLIKLPNIYPAYHMNKEHWISIIIESAKDSQIFDMLHGSFDLINKKTKKQPF